MRFVGFVERLWDFVGFYTDGVLCDFVGAWRDFVKFPVILL